MGMTHLVSGPAAALVLALFIVALWNVVLLLAEAGRPPPALAVPEPYWPDPNTDPPGPLLLLPGIGPTLAAAIVDERARGGPYRTFEDLGRVRGIGPNTLARIAPALGPHDRAGPTEGGP